MKIKNIIILSFLCLVACSKDDSVDPTENSLEQTLQLKKRIVSFDTEYEKSIDAYEYFYNDDKQVTKIINTKIDDDTLIIVTSYSYAQGQLQNSETYYGYSENKIDFFFQSSQYFFVNELLTKAISCGNEHQTPRGRKYELSYNNENEIISVDIFHSTDNCEDDYLPFITQVFEHENNNVSSIMIIDKSPPINETYTIYYAYDDKTNPKSMVNLNGFVPVSKNNVLSTTTKNRQEIYEIRYNELGYPLEEIKKIAGYDTPIARINYEYY